MAVYARKDGTLYVQFRLNGKTYIKSTGAKNKTQANALEAKMRAELNQTEVLGNPSEISFKEAIELFLDKTKSMSSSPGFHSTANWFAPHIANMQLHDLSTAWFHKTIRQKELEGAAPGTLRLYSQFIVSVVKNAENFGYRVSAFKKPKIAATQHRLRFLSIDEETRLLNALDINHPDCRMNRYLKPHDQHTHKVQDDYDLCVLLLDTGSRLNEIQKIRWDKIDLEKRVIQLWRPKVRNESILHMTDRVFDILSRRKETATTEYVFTATDGSFRKSCQGLRNTIVALGLEDCTLHTLRHTTASRLVQSGMSLYEVANILGHTNISTTVKYSHLANDQVTQKAKNILNNIHK
jgi:integrase